MTFNAKSVAEKIFLARGMFFDNRIGVEIHIKRLQELLEESLKEAHSAGVEEGKKLSTDLLRKQLERGYKAGYKDGLEEAAEIASDHALIKGPHIHKGFDFCVNQVAAEIRLKEPRSE